jgi:DNA-binding transcriptional ArsR family regulator
MPRAVRTRAFEGADPRVLRALADGTRQRILAHLGDGELRAGDIAARFDSARPTISKHLKVLLDAGLVRVRTDGRERWYAIEHAPLRHTAARVKALDELIEGGLERLGDELRRRASR